MESGKFFEEDKNMNKDKNFVLENIKLTELEESQKILELDERVLVEKSLVDSKNVEIETLTQKFEEATDKISSLASNLNSAEGNLLSFESIKSSYESKLLDLQRNLKLEQEKVSVLEKEKEAFVLHSKTCEQLTSSLQTKEKVVVTLHEKIQELLNSKEELTFEVNDLNSRLSISSIEAETLKRSLDKSLETQSNLQNEVTSLQMKANESENLQFKVSSLSEEVNNLYKEINFKGKQISDRNFIIQSLRKEKDELDALMSKLREEKETEVDKYKKEADSYLESISDMENRLLEGVNNIMNNEKHIESIQECNDILCQALSQSTNEIDEISTSNESLNTKIDVLTKEKDLLIVENTKIQEKLFEKERQYSLAMTKLAQTENLFQQEISISLQQQKDLQESEKQIKEILKVKDESLEQIKEKLAETGELCKNLRSQLTEYKEEFKNLQTKDSKDSDPEANVASSSTEDILQVKRDRRGREIEELTEELIRKNDELEAKVQALQNENSSLKELRNTKKNMEEKLNSSLLEIFFLENQTSELKLENNKLVSEVSNLTCTTKELREHNESTINANKSLIRENSALILQKDALNEQIRVMKAGRELKELLEEGEQSYNILESLKEAFIKSHSEEEKKPEFKLWVKENLFQAKGKLKEMDEHVRRLETHNTHLSVEIEDLQYRLKETKRDANLKIDDLEKVKEELRHIQESATLLEKENKDLQTKLSDYHKWRILMENNSEDLKTKVKTLNDECQKLEKEKEDLLADVNRLTCLNEAYKDKESHLQHSVTNLESQIVTINEISEKKIKEMEQLKHEKEVLIENAKRGEEEIKSFMTQLESYEQREQDFKRQIDELNENSTIIKKNIEENEKREKDLLTNIGNLNKEMFHLQSQIKSLNVEKVSVIEENVSLNLLKTELLTKVNKLEEEKVKIYKELEEIPILTRHCGHLGNENKTMKISLEELQNKNKSFETLLKENEETIDYLKKENCKLKIDFNNLREETAAEAAQLQKSFDDLAFEKHNISEELKQQLEKETSLRRRLEQANIKYSSLASKSNEDHKALEQKKEKLQKTQAELEHLKEEGEQQQQRHNAQITKMEEQLKELQDLLNTQQTLLAEKDHKVAECHKCIANHKENLDRIEAKFKLAQKNSHQKEKEMEIIREQNNKLILNLSEYQNKIKSQSSELTVRELKLRNLQDKLEAKEREYDSLFALYKEVLVNQSELKKRVDDLRDKASRLEIQKRRLESKLSKSGSRNEPIFTEASVGESDSSSSVIGASQTSLLSDSSKAETRYVGPVKGANLKRRGRKPLRRSLTSKKDPNEYDKFQLVMNSAMQEALKREGEQKRPVTRASHSRGSSDSSSKRSSMEPSSGEKRTKRFKPESDPEGLPHKLPLGLSDVSVGQESTGGVLTRSTTPLKTKETAKTVENRRPVELLDVKNEVDRVPTSPKEEPEIPTSKNIPTTTREVHGSDNVVFQSDLRSFRKTFYNRNSSSKSCKDCNPQ